MTAGLVAGGSASPSQAPPPPHLPQILVFDETRTLGPLVTAAVADLPQVPEVIEADHLRELAGHFAQRHFDLIVAGPGLDTPAGLARLRIIREEVPRSSLVIASADLASADLRSLMRTGAVDVVDLPATAAELVEPLERALHLARKVASPLPAPTTALEHVPERGVGRRVITIASASGGCGKTFLATNLAWLLSNHGKRKVCILDLDLQFGEVTASMRLRPQYTIADLVAESEGSGDRLDEHIEEFCELHESGIYVLAAPQDPTEAESIRPEDIGRVIDAARARFDDVIIDTPPVLADSVVVAFNRSDELYVMATLDIPSIRNMQVFLGTLERLHVDTEGLRLVLNKAEVDAGVEVRQVLKLFPQGFESTLPYAREVARSINAGKPVLVHAPTADISRQIRTSFRRLLPPDTQTEFDAYESSLRTGRLRRWTRKDRIAS